MRLCAVLLALLLSGCETEVQQIAAQGLPPLPQTFLSHPVTVSNLPPKPFVATPLRIEWTNAAVVDVFESTNLDRWNRIAKTTNASLTVTNTAHLRFFQVNSATNFWLAWDPVPNADGYRVYQGGKSRDYTNILTTAGTSIEFSNIRPARVYFFAATSFSTNGLESQYSQELIYTSPPTVQIPRRFVNENRRAPNGSRETR